MSGPRLCITNDILSFVRDHISLVSIPSFIKFDQDSVQRILKNFNSQIGKLSFLKSWQVADLSAAINKFCLDQSELQAIFQDNNIKNTFIDLMRYSNGIFQYKNDSVNKKIYLEKFKKTLLVLSELLTEEKLLALFKILSEAKGEAEFLCVVPLAYQELANSEELLDGFRAGEFIGHEVAYKIAQNKNLKELHIVDKDKNLLESYFIKEIIVNDVGKTERNKALMGSILIPNYSNNFNKDSINLHIAWAGTHNSETLFADFERMSGEESYRKSEDQILSQITSVISDLNKKYSMPIKIIFSGHSLGGAYAQLSYHSLQRILALNVNNPHLKNAAETFDGIFVGGLKKAIDKANYVGSIQSLDKFHLPSNCISEMQINVWNSVGVLSAVEQNSNELSTILSKQMNIKQKGNFGFVGGDIFQMVGHGSILSDVSHNGANVIVLDIQPDTARMATTLIAPVGGGFAGAVIGPALFGLSTVSGGVGLFGLTLFSALMTKYNSHTMKHFEYDSYPSVKFKLYASHHPDGTLNEDPNVGWQRIQRKLTNKSCYILDTGASLINKLMR